MDRHREGAKACSSTVLEFTCHCCWFYKRSRRRGVACHYQARFHPEEQLKAVRTKTSAVGSQTCENSIRFISDIGRLFVLFGSEPYHVA